MWHSFAEGRERDKSEIEAFGEDFPFEYLHSDRVKNIGMWEPKPETHLVLTTPEVLASAYNEYNLELLFLKYLVPEQFGPTILEYTTPKSPMLLEHHSGPGYIYREIQNCNNILREKCRAIACISSERYN